MGTTRVRSATATRVLRTCWKAACSESAIALRVNAQLIDTRTDTHVWAQQYDRDLADLFAVQSEIAQEIAERNFDAKISAAEKMAIERSPTADLTAFDLYSQRQKSSSDCRAKEQC